MSENKFIKRLKGEQTAKSVLEIKNESAKTSFANMPKGTSNAINVYSDHRGNATAVLEGTDVWKLNNSQFSVVPNAFGDGRDFTSTYTVAGSSLWVNATYTFDQPKIFTGATQWTLKLCGHSLLSSLSNTIGFSLIIKFGNAVAITKSFSVSESAFEFCKEFIIDFSESEQSAIKVANGDTMTVQLLCADATASATIYNGMTTLVAQQRRVDGDTVASDLNTFEDIEVEVADIADDLADHIADKNNPHEVTKAQVGLGNCDNTSDLDKPISTATQTALNGKVNIDGTSIMTGPLKMRATSSFQCAIAPFWDGVGFYKLNSDDSVTLIASIETPDGFVPWVTNTYNIGSSLKKWKNLYLAGKAYMSVINNGYDIAVPVTNSADTLALKSEVDLAANSGRMITGQGVWYAKMYAATVAPSAENGTNYADFSQTDGQGNPIIVIYERQSGAWVQSETITPPAEYDGYVAITSKIWDIAEQTGQQGGRVLWNHQSKDFTPYPQIISFENAALTGVPTAPLPTNDSPNNQIATKEYVDSHTSDGGYHPELFAHERDDHIRDDVQWLRADTFSWQDGTVYEEAYNHLVDDLPEELPTITALISLSVRKLIRDSSRDVSGAYHPYAWTYILNGNRYTYWTNSETPVIGDGVWDYATTLQDPVSSVSATGTSLPEPETETISGTTIEYYTASDGHKIVLADQESNVASIYTATGVAWYYILDTVNEKFKLPRELPITDKIKGNGLALGIGSSTTGYIEMGLRSSASSSDNYLQASAAASATSVGSVTTDTAYYGDARRSLGIVSNPDKSGIISHRANENGQQYLYFYVGSFTQTALENTAGLNASLFNNKADINLQNATSENDFVIERQEPTALNNYTWYRKYRSGWVEQGGRTSTGTNGASVSLPIAMADANYSISCTLKNASTSASTGGFDRYPGAGVITTTGFWADQPSNANYYTCWEVKGIAAN